MNFETPFVILGAMAVILPLWMIAGSLSTLAVVIKDRREKEEIARERDEFRQALREIAHREKPPSEYAAKVLEEHQ